MTLVIYFPLLLWIKWCSIKYTYKHMICDLTNINDIIKTEGLNLLVVSYGGSCSNSLVKKMEDNGYTCTTQTWHDILCHCPEYVEVDIPIIYIYDNPIKSFMSMKKRGTGYWGTNQRKLSNNKNVKLSNENLLKLMIKQFNSWTNKKRENVLIVKAGELFKSEIVDKIQTFLNKEIQGFPMKYNTPKVSSNTKLKDIKNKNLVQLFRKYKPDINKIRNR